MGMLSNQWFSRIGRRSNQMRVCDEGGKLLGGAFDLDVVVFQSEAAFQLALNDFRVISNSTVRICVSWEFL